VAEGFDALITAGGDGTCNEAINGIVEHPIALGVLPFGGSNVLARELGVPLHPLKAAELIARKHIRKIDLGLINGRYFSMMAGCGYDAYAISRTSRRIKKIIHRYAYLWAAVKDFVGYQPTEITVTIDGGRAVEKGTFVVVSNSHFYGGSHQMALYAKVDDGFLDLCVYQGKLQIGLARFAFNLLVKNHLSMKNVKYHRVREVEIQAAKRTLVQVDGDLLGELPMTARIVPGAIDVFS
jgi:diacylglycerol kinase (ATP)